MGFCSKMSLSALITWIYTIGMHGLIQPLLYQKPLRECRDNKPCNQYNIIAWKIYESHHSSNTMEEWIVSSTVARQRLYEYISWLCQTLCDPVRKLCDFIIKWNTKLYFAHGMILAKLFVSICILWNIIKTFHFRSFFFLWDPLLTAHPSSGRLKWRGNLHNLTVSG